MTTCGTGWGGVAIMLCPNLSQDTAILIEVFPGFHQSLQANVGAVPQIGHDHFLPDPFHFINYLIT
jgi:hypothetical protein